MDASTSNRLPAIFFGHGSPMNALEENRYTQTWRQLAASIPKPRAILAISAHWTTRGTAVTAALTPRTIHDFGGFPQALFDIRYPAPGDPALAARIRDLLAPTGVELDQAWGLDHVTWSVLLHAYPEADVPVLQLSIDAMQSAAYHLALGRRLSALREEGVLLIASGNVVHNLRTMIWGDTAATGYDWAIRFNDRVRAHLLAGEVDALADYEQWGDDARLAAPTPEHYLPLLYVAGSKRNDEHISVAVDGIEGGSISMLSAVVGSVAAA